jgi:protein-disulfide isomerase
MSTKSTRKLSKREREEQQATRRYMLIGGGLFAAAAAAGLGVSMMPANFPVLEGNDTLSDRLEASKARGHTLHLTGKGAEIDVLVVGNTSCSFCKAFVDDGLNDLTAWAKKNKLAVHYASLGSSPASLGSSRLLSCFAKGSNADPETILREVYAAGAEMEGGMSLEDAAWQYGKLLAVADAEIETCLADSGLEAAARTQAISQNFNIQGTPTFLVAQSDEPQTIRWFNGYGSASGMLRQIENARRGEGMS